MIERSRDAEYLNWLVNHPDVRPGAGGDGSSYIDLSQAVADEQNVVLVGHHGGFFFGWSAPGTWEAHAFLLARGRGSEGFALAHEALAWMTRHGASHVWARIDARRRDLRLFTLKAGFRPSGERQNLDLGGGIVAYDLFSWRP